MESRISVLRETPLNPNFPLSRQEFREVLEVILEALGLEDHELEIRLVDDAEIARLNKEFMGCTGPTNVLSFPAADDDDEMVIVSDDEESMQLGSLALSVDALGRETDLYGQEPVLHLSRLLAHGILHLAGHDHGDLMYDLTDAAVAAVEDVYCPALADDEEGGNHEA
ncbi:Endoribonuclease YbeY [Pseudodesulfovibrio profundus]|uniref:Endoribonuclease YbeY n=1 Tax=Pseudodesulfovibrio profundus TaxID=57320 RepID=A0A2C8F6N4_9BACT|nr:rRNA maturation RNase YbeY [Pseudodesulfovibrio profundus]SOB58081.1 Endoribonuclease YbeY [Pseudodesulfovibrio profundus]